MIFFKKKEETPEIPMAPTFSEMPEIQSGEKTDEELPELPSLPNNSKNDSLNQEIVKSAIGDNSSEENEVADDSSSEFSGEEEMIPSIPRKTTPEKSSWGRSSIMDSPITTKQKITPVIPVVPRSPLKVQKPATPHYNIPQTSKECLDVEPVFVRIDKFQSAKKNIETIKQRVKEIETTIEKIQQTKIKEDEEIKSWLAEVENLKTKLAEIDSDVFSQING